MYITSSLYIPYNLPITIQADSDIDEDDPLYSQIMSAFSSNKTSSSNNDNENNTNDTDSTDRLFDPESAAKACKNDAASSDSNADGDTSVRSEKKYKECVINWRVWHSAWMTMSTTASSSSGNGDINEKHYKIDPSEVTIIRTSKHNQ